MGVIEQYNLVPNEYVNKIASKIDTPGFFHTF